MATRDCRLIKASLPCSRASDCFGRPLALCSLVLSLCSLCSLCASSLLVLSPSMLSRCLFPPSMYRNFTRRLTWSHYRLHVAKRSHIWLSPTTPSYYACDFFLPSFFISPFIHRSYGAIKTLYHNLHTSISPSITL